VSLSKDPAFSVLKEHFICGYRDITNEPYSGMSGWHETDGNAIKTTNGAGPRNLQLFMMTPDGIVLHCLPGYWDAQDLVHELELAWELNNVWKDPVLTVSQKNGMFSQMQVAHTYEHSPMMVRRSRMQGFDQKHEAKHRLWSSDTIRDPYLLVNHSMHGPMPQMAFKTTDQIAHERMSVRPFLPYERFDVANFSDYGKERYEKNEDFRTADGRVDRDKLQSHRQWNRRKRVLKQMPARVLPAVGPIVRNYVW
jgi:hypothetical protein